MVRLLLCIHPHAIQLFYKLYPLSTKKRKDAESAERRARPTTRDGALPPMTGPRSRTLALLAAGSDPVVDCFFLGMKIIMHWLPSVPADRQKKVKKERTEPQSFSLLLLPKSGGSTMSTPKGTTGDRKSQCLLGVCRRTMEEFCPPRAERRRRTNHLHKERKDECRLLAPHQSART